MCWKQGELTRLSSFVQKKLQICNDSAEKKKKEGKIIFKTSGYKKLRTMLILFRGNVRERKKEKRKEKRKERKTERERKKEKRKERKTFLWLKEAGEKERDLAVDRKQATSQASGQTSKAG